MSVGDPASWLGRLRASNAAAQASIPGAYAWAVTVAPGAWSPSSPAVAKVAALAAVIALFGGIAAERRWGARGHTASFWLFVLLCALAWSSSPLSLVPARFDAVRGLLGMSGWALYAYSSAAPASSRESGPEVGDASRSRRWGDAGILGAALALVILLQSVGWRTSSLERAILVRVVAIASCLAVFGAMTDLANERHRDGRRASLRARLRRAWGPLAALALLAVAGVVLHVWR
ncbi:MAG TPA: hypothetical protein VKU41_09350 [Polyangiaceae bacterium]|nr:hypothetical protein [Polyangiaceae bacterium]